MKLILIIPLLFSIAGLGQTTSTKIRKLPTSKYQGFYWYGKDVEKSSIGALLIYPETDSTVLFYIDLNRGAPSYNMGSLYGRIKVINDSGIFYSESDSLGSLGKGCKFLMQFFQNKIKIETIEDYYDCGFGYGVDVDGEFIKKSNKKIDYFEDQEGKKIYFEKTKPQEYYKN